MGKEKKKWYQTGEFEDGYQFGDIFRTVKNAINEHKEEKSEEKKEKTKSDDTKSQINKIKNGLKNSAFVDGIKKSLNSFADDYDLKNSNVEKTDDKSKYFTSINNGKLGFDKMIRSYGFMSEEDRKNYIKENPNLYAVMGGYKYEPNVLAWNHTPLSEKDKLIVAEAQERDKYYQDYGVLEFANNSKVNINEIDNQIVELKDAVNNAKKSISISNNLLVDNNFRNVELAKLDTILKQYGCKDFSELNAMLSQKKQIKVLAQNSLELKKMTLKGDENSDYYDPEFEKWVSIGKNLHSKNLTGEYLSPHRALNPVEMVHKIYGEYKNNLDGIAKLNLDYTKQSEIVAILQMTDKQRDLYNYYLGKEYYNKVNSGTANKYLEYLKTQYNILASDLIQKGLKDLPFFQYAYSGYAGLQSFADNIETLEENFLKNDTYKAETAIQQANKKVRQDVVERDGFIGQIGYDLINTVSQQLPSILTSTAIGVVNPVAGAAVGASLSGLSATGNAYQEALRLGFEEEEARLYSIGIGVSDAALTYTLGGISKLGGKIPNNIISNVTSGIDNGIAKFALEYGGKIVSEGIEEGIQEILDPIFKAISTNTSVEYWGGIDWSAVVYSALLGGLSSGVFELSHKANSINNSFGNRQIEISNFADKSQNSNKVDGIEITPYISENNGIRTIGAVKSIDEDAFIDGLWDDGKNREFSANEKNVENSQLESVENISENDIIRMAKEYLQSPEGQKDTRPYLRHRPAYAKNQIETVYENGKNEFGKVYDPSGLEVPWDRSKPRNGQWDMGHVPGQKYSVVHAKYVLEMMTPEEFKNWHDDPRNYRPELPSTNRGHKYE